MPLADLAMAISGLVTLSGGCVIIAMRHCVLGLILAACGLTALFTPYILEGGGMLPAWPIAGAFGIGITLCLYFGFHYYKTENAAYRARIGGE